MHEHYKVIAAAVRGQLKARKRQSAYIYMDAVLHFVNGNKILPRGVLITAPSVQDWACKVGAAMRKLVLHLELEVHTMWQWVLGWFLYRGPQLR